MRVLPGDRRWWVLAASALPLLTVGFDLVAVSMALTDMATSLPASISQLHWIVAGYGLAAGVGALAGWRVRRRLAWRSPFVGAMLLLGAGSAGLAWAQSAWAALGGRLVMGLSVGIVIGLTAPLLTELFPGPARGKAVTAWAASLALGIPLGPPVAGWLLDRLWWGSVFLVNIPIVLVAAVLVALLPVASRAGVSAGVRATAPVRILAGLPGFGWGSALGALATFALSVPLLLLPQFFRDVVGTTALGAGLRIMPVILGLMIASQLSESLLPVVGLRSIVAVGFLLSAAGFTAGAVVDPGAAYAIVAGWLTVAGLGFGLSLIPALHAAVATLDTVGDAPSGAPDGPAIRDAGFTLVQALRQVAGAVGVLVVGGVFQVARATAGSTPDAFETGLAVAMGVSAGVMLIGAGLAFAFLPTRVPTSVTAMPHENVRGVAAPSATGLAGQSRSDG